MTKAHQKAINAAISQLEQMENDLQTMLDTLREAHDGKSELWLYSDAGQEAGSRLDSLASGVDLLSNARESLTEALGDNV